MRWFYTCTNIGQTNVFNFTLYRRNGANSKYNIEDNKLQPTTMHFTRPEDNEEPKYEEMKR